MEPVLETGPRTASLTTSLSLVEPDGAVGQAKELLDGYRARFGAPSPIISLLAGSPATLKGYLKLSDALAGGSLRGKLREQIALLVAAKNECAYCTNAHVRIAAAMGLDEDAIEASRAARAIDPKADAAVKFAAAVIDGRGRVDDKVLARVREAGFTDGEIVEIVGNVALNIFRNYIALAGGIDSDEDAPSSST